MLKKILIALSFLMLALPAYAADVTMPSVQKNITTSSAAATTTASRRILIIQNTSDATIYCKFGADAVVGEGIVLNPQPASGQAGGAFFFDVAVPLGTLNCIHNSTGNKTLNISEGS